MNRSPSTDEQIAFALKQADPERLPEDLSRNLRIADATFHTWRESGTPASHGLRPIIVLGAGRTGSSVFHRMLSTHPDLWWLSALSDTYPDKAFLNKLLMQALEILPLERVLRNRFPPSEAYAYWEFHCKGFSTPCRDLVPEDVTEKIKRRMRGLFSGLTEKDRKRILLKITGWPRIGFFSEIFQDAKFIHIIRDGRAVANSLINVDFWRGWAGPEKWRWGPLSASHNEEWEAHDRSFIVLAAIQWKIHMDAVEIAKNHVRNLNLLEIKYEQLCDDPIGLFRDVADFCEIGWTPRFESALNSFSLTNTNDKWERELNDRQKSDLAEVLRSDLRRYDYV